MAIETVQGARASRRRPVLRHDSSVRANVFARRYVSVRDLVPLVPLPPISDLTHGEETSLPYTLASRCRPTSRRPFRTFGTGWSRSLDHAWRRASRPKRSSGNPPTPHHRHAFPRPQARHKICYGVPEDESRLRAGRQLTGALFKSACEESFGSFGHTLGPHLCELTTMRYAHLSPDRLRSAVSRLDELTSAPAPVVEMTDSRAQARAHEALNEEPLSRN